MNVDELYIKLKIKKSDTTTDAIRDEGLLFERIAEAIDLDRDSIVEIDESNYLSEFKKMEKKFGRD